MCTLCKMTSDAAHLAHAVGQGENNLSCPTDCCSHKCGDGVCQPYVEDCCSCPQDCVGWLVASAVGVCCGGAAGCNSSQSSAVVSCAASCSWF